MDGQVPNLRTQIPETQVEARMRVLIPYTDWVRTFSMVDGLQGSGRVAHRLGYIVALGAWLGPETTQVGLQANRTNIQNLNAAGTAGEAEMLIVGGEVLQRGDLPLCSLLAYINQVKAAVQPVHNIPVTTAGIYSQINKPAISALLSACDIIMVNIYPFWSGVAVSDAMTVLHQDYLNLRSVARGKAIWISETGWPAELPPVVRPTLG